MTSKTDFHYKIEISYSTFKNYNNYLQILPNELIFLILSKLTYSSNIYNLSKPLILDIINMENIVSDFLEEMYYKNLIKLIDCQFCGMVNINIDKEIKNNLKEGYKTLFKFIIQYVKNDLTSLNWNPQFIIIYNEIYMGIYYGHTNLVLYNRSDIFNRSLHESFSLQYINNIMKN